MYKISCICLHEKQFEGDLPGINEIICMQILLQELKIPSLQHIFYLKCIIPVLPAGQPQHLKKRSLEFQFRSTCWYRKNATFPLGEIALYLWSHSISLALFWESGIQGAFIKLQSLNASHRSNDSPINIIILPPSECRFTSIEGAE